MNDENISKLNDPISEIDSLRKNIIYKKISHKRLAKTIAIIFALAMLLFIPIEAAYLQEPE